MRPTVNEDLVALLDVAYRQVPHLEEILFFVVKHGAVELRGDRLPGMLTHQQRIIRVLNRLVEHLLHPAQIVEIHFVVDEQFSVCHCRSFRCLFVIAERHSRARRYARGHIGGRDGPLARRIIEREGNL